MWTNLLSVKMLEQKVSDCTCEIFLCFLTRDMRGFSSLRVDWLILALFNFVVDGLVIFLRLDDRLWLVFKLIDVFDALFALTFAFLLMDAPVDEPWSLQAVWDLLVPHKNLLSEDLKLSLTFYDAFVFDFHCNVRLWLNTGHRVDALIVNIRSMTDIVCNLLSLRYCLWHIAERLYKVIHVWLLVLVLE